MTYLQLCRRAAQECGVASGSAIATALPTVVGATGSLGRICNWVNDALGDICSERDDWDFMRSSSLLGAGVSFATVAGQSSYPLGTGAGTVGVLADAFGKWDRDTVRGYSTSGGFQGEMTIDEVPFDVWRDGYTLGAMRSVQTQPSVFAVGPDQSICLGPPPNGNYTITADYFTAPTDMVADADVPVGLPAQFHLLIVYGAMAKAGQYEAAGELVQRAERESAPMMAQLMALRAPRLLFCGALA